MKKFGLIAAIFAVTMFVVAGSAMALPFNVRPYTPTTGELDELQGVLDSLVVSGPSIDAINDQSAAALFTSQGSGGAVVTFIIEIASWAPYNEFGLYSSDDPTNKALIFSGADGAGTQKIVSFMANGDILVNFAIAASGFSSSWGFYEDVYNSWTGTTYSDGDPTTLDYTLYSEDDKNINGETYALIYQGNDLTEIQIPPYSAGTFSSDEWIVAWEDWLLQDCSDEDFTDGVFLIESIQPVPEPATMFLLGSGLIGLAGLGRKKLFKK